MVAFKKLVLQTPEERDAAQKRYEEEYAAKVAETRRLVERAALIAQEGWLNAWETRFAKSVASAWRAYGSVSARQLAVLKRIDERFDDVAQKPENPENSGAGAPHSSP